MAGVTAAAEPVRTSPPRTRPGAESRGASDRNERKLSAYQALFNKKNNAQLDQLDHAFSHAVNTTDRPNRDQVNDRANQILANTPILKAYLGSTYDKIEAEANRRGTFWKQLKSPTSNRMMTRDEYIAKVGIIIIKHEYLQNEVVNRLVKGNNVDHAARKIEDDMKQDLKAAAEKKFQVKVLSVENLTDEDRAKINAYKPRPLEVAAFVIARSLNPVKPEKIDRYVKVAIVEAGNADEEGTYDGTRQVREDEINGKQRPINPVLRRNPIVGWESNARLEHAKDKDLWFIFRPKVVRLAIDQLIIRPGEFIVDTAINIGSLYSFVKMAQIGMNIMDLNGGDAWYQRYNPFDRIARWGVANFGAFVMVTEQATRYKMAVKTGRASVPNVLLEQIGINNIAKRTAKYLQDRVPADEFFYSYGVSMPHFVRLFDDKVLRFSFRKGLHNAKRMSRTEFKLYNAQLVANKARTVADIADSIDGMTERLEAILKQADKFLPEKSSLRKGIPNLMFGGVINIVERLGSKMDKVGDMAEIPDVLGRMVAVVAYLVADEQRGRSVGGTVYQRAQVFLRLYGLLGATPQLPPEMASFMNSISESHAGAAVGRVTAAPTTDEAAAAPAATTPGPVAIPVVEIEGTEGPAAAAVAAETPVAESAAVPDEVVPASEQLRNNVRIFLQSRSRRLTEAVQELLKRELGVNVIENVLKEMGLGSGDINRLITPAAPPA